MGIRHITIHARNPGPWTGPGNNTFLLPGRVPTLIDAGVGEPEHLRDIEARVAGSDHPQRALARVIVTHAHSDHINGVTAIAARWPDASFEKMAWPGRDDRWPVQWKALQDADVVDAGDGRLRVIHTPGHAPDHIALFDDESRTLFCGDLVVSGSTVVIPAGRGGDLAAYLESIRRVLALEPRLLLPAHGPAIEDPASILQEYLDHRRFRETQIVNLLQRAPATATMLAEHMYPGLRPELREAALGSVLAHLIKLRDEGRAEENEDYWRLR
jgi:glyoxylase-like metal-dependent hydrolase (beta-lactamase superfamily II)